MDVTNSRTLSEIVRSSSTIHIYGAGLNTQRPAHTAVKELSDRGWAIAPIHPRDAGATIEGFPIRPKLDEGVTPEIVVIFLAPERARSVVKRLILSINPEKFPLIWFQHGAEDDDSISALNELGAKYVQDDCIVRYTERNDYHCEISILPQLWCLQVRSPEEDGCSIWSVHSSNECEIREPANNLEWVGSLNDLKNSQSTIPRYIRSLKTGTESLDELVIRLAN